jgi:hypothetical protein
VAECRESIRNLTSFPAPANLVAAAMEFNLTDLLDEKLRAIATRADQSKRRQTKLPGE